MTAITDPKIVVKDLLTTHWAASSTSSVTPTFGTGWFNEESKYPQVTITDPRENPSAGGETGYRGIKADGSGPTQTMLGTLDVNVWSTRDASAVNPKQLVFEFSEEVKRIVRKFYTATTVSDAGLQWLAWGGRLERVDSDVRPAVFRYLCEVRYSYQES